MALQFTNSGIEQPHGAAFALPTGMRFKEFKPILLALLTVAFAAGEAHAYIVKVKPGRENVHLWSTTDRDDGAKSEIHPDEEVNVIAEKRLASGEVWYQVRARRYPGWRAENQTGWIDSKYFDSVERAKHDDVDPDCEKPESLKAQSKDLKKILDKAAQQGKSQAQKPQATSPSTRMTRSKSGFIWPAQGRFSSGFGPRRHPVWGLTKLHNGIDISRNYRSKVVAAKTGKIVTSLNNCPEGRAKKCNRGSGNLVVIQHNDGTTTIYAHLNPSCRFPRVGSTVEQGQQIGCVGNSGASTGAHLHFGVKRNGRYINPLDVLPKRGRQ